MRHFGFLHVGAEVVNLGSQRFRRFRDTTLFDSLDDLIGGHFQVFGKNISNDGRNSLSHRNSPIGLIVLGIQTTHPSGFLVQSAHNNGKTVRGDRVNSQDEHHVNDDLESRTCSAAMALAPGIVVWRIWVTT